MNEGENYHAWQVSAADFPVKSPLADKISFLLNYAVLAPSTHNTQPWLFKVQDNVLQVSADPALALPASDPTGRNLQISLGCCVANVVIAAHNFGLGTVVRWQPERIEVTFTDNASKTDKSLFAAITKRFSDKLPYDPQSLKPADQQAIEAVPKPKGVHLHLVTAQAGIASAADLHAQAILNYAGQQAFFKELSQWLRPTKSKAHDGMPGFVIGLSQPQSIVLRGMIKNVKPTVKVLAKKDAAAIMSSSAVAFITSEADIPESWFSIGQYFETLLLTLTNRGLVGAPQVAMIEDSVQRQKARKVFQLSGKPQLFFRLGYSKHEPYHTPRHKPVLNAMETQQKLLRIIPTDVQSHQTTVGKYTINYITAGSGQPLLMLHGANIGLAQWYQNIADFAENYQVYALDLPGAGSSTKVDFHKTDFETDYLNIVDQFITQQKLDKVDLVGSSFGGWIALRLAIAQKPYVNKVVLSNPLGFTTHMPLQFRPVSIKPFAIFLTKTALRPQRNNKNLEKFMRDVFFDKQLALAPEFIDYFYELSQTSHNLLFISRLAHPLGMRKELYLADQLPKIKRPVMVIWGNEDPLMPLASVEKAMNQIPGVEIKILENVGHMPPVEVPTEFNRLALAFLKK